MNNGREHNNKILLLCKPCCLSKKAVTKLWKYSETRVTLTHFAKENSCSMRIQDGRYEIRIEETRD